MPALERQKLLHKKGEDQEKIRKYIFERWPDVWAYHEDPRNPEGWNNCFLKREYDLKTKVSTKNNFSF